MPQPARRSLVPGLLLAAALGLAACGSSDDATIPPDRAAALLAQLDEVEQAVAANDCTTARTNVSQLEGAVNALPEEVGVETKGDLRELVGNLSTLTTDQCDDAATAPAGGVEQTDSTTSDEAVTTAPTTTDTESTEEPAPPEKPADEETDTPSSSGNGPPGPVGNTNGGGGSSGGIGGGD